MHAQAIYCPLGGKFVGHIVLPSLPRSGHTSPSNCPSQRLVLADGGLGTRQPKDAETTGTSVFSHIHVLCDIHPVRQSKLRTLTARPALLGF